jgi:hypothetical protein
VRHAPLITALVALAMPAEAAPKQTPDDEYKADSEARKAADRDCPNDGEHNLVRDANDETKWVCLREKL